MQTNKLVITKPWVSIQTDSDGNPHIELQTGDELELREDGLYFTRRIEKFNEKLRLMHPPNVSIYGALANAFEHIRRGQNGEIQSMAEYMAKHKLSQFP